MSPTTPLLLCKKENLGLSIARAGECSGVDHPPAWHGNSMASDKGRSACAELLSGHDVLIALQKKCPIKPWEQGPWPLPTRLDLTASRN